MILLQLTWGVWAPRADWGSTSSFLLLCQELLSPCSGHRLSCRELKFHEVRRIKALCVGGPALLLWLYRAPVSVLLGLCKERTLCHGPELWQHSRNNPVSLVGRMVFVTRMGSAPVLMTTQCWAAVPCWPGFLLSFGSLLLLFPALGPNGSSSLYAAALAAWPWSNQSSSKNK